MLVVVCAHFRRLLERRTGAETTLKEPKLSSAPWHPLRRCSSRLCQISMLMPVPRCQGECYMLCMCHLPSHKAPLAQEVHAPAAVEEVLAPPAPAAVKEVLAPPAPAAVEEVLAPPAPAAVKEVLAPPAPAAVKEVLAPPAPAAVEEVLAPPAPALTLLQQEFLAEEKAAREKVQEMVKRYRAMNRGPMNKMQQIEVDNLFRALIKTAQLKKMEAEEEEARCSQARHRIAPACRLVAWSHVPGSQLGSCRRGQIPSCLTRNTRTCFPLGFY